MALVSVCIPTYNGARYLGEAINSIFNQTYSDFELLVIDDSSIDTTLQVVGEFHDERLRVFKSPERLGLVSNWNRCLQLARGKYVCIFHQDDVMLAENLEKKINILEKRISVGFVHSNAFVIDTEGNTLAKYFPSGYEESLIQKRGKYFEKLILDGNTVCCPSVIVRKECYDRLGVFDTRLPYTCDWEMWMRIALFYEIAYLEDLLIKYRQHEGNESNKYKGNVRELQEAVKAKRLVVRKFRSQIPESSKLETQFLDTCARTALDSAYGHYYRSQYTEAKKYLMMTLKVRPAWVKNDRFIRLTAKLALGERGTEAAKKIKWIWTNRVEAISKK